jgi:hypothetical protein
MNQKKTRQKTLVADRRGRTEVLILCASAGLIIKLLNAIPALICPEGVDKIIPASGGLSGIALTGCWILSTILLLHRQIVVGSVSALAFCAVSLASAIVLTGKGFGIWGSWQMLTSIITGILVILTLIAKNHDNTTTKEKENGNL